MMLSQISSSTHNPFKTEYFPIFPPIGSTRQFTEKEKVQIIKCGLYAPNPVYKACKENALFKILPSPSFTKKILIPTDSIPSQAADEFGFLD